MDYTSNPLATDQDDLTAVLNEDRYARTLANIARRAERLWEDGYTCRQSFQGTFVEAYDVFTPRGERYMVKITPTPKDPFLGDKCTCPSFSKYGECKHHLALQFKLRDEAQAAAYDALEEAEGEWGCDPHHQQPPGEGEGIGKQEKRRHN